MRSFVARTVQAPAYNERPALTCAYFSYWADLHAEAAELYPRPDRLIICAPTNDNQTLIIVYWPISDFHTVRADIEGNFMKALDLAPALAERVRNARRSERFQGTADLPFYFRKPHGPGWALVGDAGYHKDPITAQGITDAFRDADLLAGAIDAGFGNQQPLDDALSNYEEQRNEAVMPLYELTQQFASHDPPGVEMQQLFGALLHNQEQTNRFFGTIAGSVPIAEFYSAENMRRITEGAVQGAVV
jgi:2-polyprenyl-6-methoxyphenol hydroxylase-like FAD-dependent oxidoreductase